MPSPHTPRFLNWSRGRLWACALALCVWMPSRAARAGASPAAAQMAWAEENLNAGRYREVVALLRKAVGTAANGSERQEATFRLARALRIVGGYREGLKFCEQVLTSHPKNKPFRCLKGELLTETGRYREALALFNTLLKEDPKFERAWAMRKQVALILGKKEIVKKTTDHFFALFNEQAEYFHSDKVKDPLVLAYVGLGIKDENPKDAFEVGFSLAEALIEKRGIRNPEAHLWAARMAYDIYHFGFAAKRYRTILKMRPKYPDALAGMAQILISAQNKIKQAEPLLKQALAINPHHINALVTLAVIEMREDHFEEAKRRLDAALQVNPKHLDALAALAFYHHYRKEPDREAAVEKKVLAVNPACADYYCEVGDLIESKYGFWEAPAYYRKAIALDPEYWRGYYGLGMNTSRQGAQGEAEGKRLLLKAFSMNRFNVWSSNMVKVLDKIIGDREQQVPPQYAASKTPHFMLKFHGKEAAVLRPYIEEWAEDAYRWETKKFGFEPKGPLTIELCYSFQDQAARTVGLPNLGALGVCFGKLCTVVSPREGKGGFHPFNWRKVLVHEFGHVMTLQMSGFRVPRWYTEAFSTYLENDSRLASDAMMVNAIARGQLKPIEKMNEYFRGNMLMAYVHGRYIIEYIDKQFGFGVHRKALRMFAEGKPVQQVLPAVTGKSLAELNRGQFAYVKKFFKTKVRLRPPYDPAIMAKLELAAAREDAPAQATADLAVAHLATRRLALAEAGALKALEKDAHCADAINVLAVLAYNKKDYLGAKKLFEQSTRSAPGRSFTAWHRLGIIYKKEGRTHKAIQAFEQARKLYPRYVGPDNPHHLLPELYLDLEPPQKEQALAGWLEAIEANTDDVEAAKKGLQLAVKIKNWKAAVTCATRCIEIDPYDVAVHRWAGRAYEAIPDLARAAREYRVATVLDEKDVESWVALARVEKARGKREAAVRAVRAALAIDATHGGAQRLRKELEIQR